MTTQDCPLVTIAVPCFNHERYVHECIMSIVNQDYENIELIVIDDGSTDKSTEVVKELEALCLQRFRRFEFRIRENKGISATLNEALGWASGDFFSPIASDDILFNDKISKQVAEFLQREINEPRLVALYAGVEYVNSESKPLRVKRGKCKYSNFEDVILRRDFLPTPTFFVSRKALVDAGGFNSNYSIEDFYIRLKLTSVGGLFYTMPDVLVKYRTHSNNFSKRSNEIWAGVNVILDDYRTSPIYRKALAHSMMVQAHDLQTVSKLQGISFISKAIKQWPWVIVSKSMLKFLIKTVISPAR